MTISKRTIKRNSIVPGGSVDVTVTLTDNLKSVALQEIPPEGWTIKRGPDNAFAFRPNEWVWKGNEGEMTAIYTLTAPMDISIGEYRIDGNLMHADGVRVPVDGDKIIVY